LQTLWAEADQAEQLLRAHREAGTLRHA
jgi:hypothetical protein